MRFVVFLKKNEGILQIRTSKQYVNCTIIEYCHLLRFAHELSRAVSCAADWQVSALLRGFVEAGENDTRTDAPEPGAPLAPQPLAALEAPRGGTRRWALRLVLSSDSLCRRSSSELCLLFAVLPITEMT